MSKQFNIKQFSYVYVQLQCQRQFHFKQLSLVLARSLNVSTQFDLKNISISSYSV